MTRLLRGGDSGFTLVELLVVITIIGVLMSLLLPAVQSVRESAREVQCRNNLKQLSLAYLEHHAKQEFFPTGGWGYLTLGDPDRGFGPEQPGGWGYNVLPYLEQLSLHDMGKGESPSAKRNAIVRRCAIPLAVFNCPSRRRADAYRDNHDYNLGVGTITQAGRSDYGANQGTSINHTCLGTGPDTYQQAEGLNWNHDLLDTFNGVGHRRSMVRMAHVRDGATSTLMLAEKYINPDNYADGRDLGDNENLYLGYDTDMYRSMHRDCWPPLQDRPGLYSRHRFGSAHAAHFHAALCDGSVHRIDYSIDREVYWRLGNREDGYAVSADAL